MNAAHSASAQITSMSCCATSAGAQVTFTLSADALVSAEVLNIAGRTVRTLPTDRPMLAGPNTLVWDGRSASGTPAPSGVYLVRVSAADDRGAQAQALATIRIRR